LPEWDDPEIYDTAPEAITRVAPTYPDSAREARVDGTVIMKALVCKDGSVGDIVIVNSIPMLDAAAAAAVYQWQFKPAVLDGRPVATWVAVPARISLH
jgi:protein TonB